MQTSKCEVKQNVGIRHSWFEWVGHSWFEWVGHSWFEWVGHLWVKWVGQVQQSELVFSGDILDHHMTTSFSLIELPILWPTIERVGRATVKAGTQKCGMEVMCFTQEITQIRCRKSQSMVPSQQLLQSCNSTAIHRRPSNQSLKTFRQI